MTIGLLAMSFRFRAMSFPNWQRNADRVREKLAAFEGTKAGLWHF
jgi:hypothetical protein